MALYLLIQMKVIRPTAATLREKIGDQQITRDVPKDQRKSDQELLAIGLHSIGQANKDRWRQAPYCWSEKGFLYEPYYYLTEKRDPHTNDFIWDNDLLWKFARDHKVELFAARQAMPGLLNAKGALRKRAPRQTTAQRGHDGRCINDVPEMRKLTEATRSQVMYRNGTVYKKTMHLNPQSETGLRKVTQETNMEKRSIWLYQNAREALALEVRMLRVRRRIPRHGKYPQVPT